MSESNINQYTNMGLMISLSDCQKLRVHLEQELTRAQTRIMELESELAKARKGNGDTAAGEPTHAADHA